MALSPWGWKLPITSPTILADLRYARFDASPKYSVERQETLRDVVHFLLATGY